MRFAFFDLETTGVDPYADRIVEIAVHRPGVGEYVGLINPERPIPPGATEVHGISDDDVALAPPFRDVAGKIREMIEGAILVGYASRNFDTIMLDEEFRRAKVEQLPRDEFGSINVPEIDLFRVWKARERRTLVTAARRFAGRDLDNAHTAQADAAILDQVARGMMAEFGIDEIEMLADSHPPDEVDRDGKFKRLESGVIVFNFGKHKDEPVSENRDYLDWMMTADFSPEVKAWIARLR